MPMIPLGLKETKEINFMEPFSDFILEHYSEEPSIYMDSIADITDTRQVSCRFLYLIVTIYSTVVCGLNTGIEDAITWWPRRSIAFSLLQPALLCGTSLLSARSQYRSLLRVVWLADGRAFLSADDCLRKGLYSVQSGRHIHTDRCPAWSHHRTGTGPGGW